MSGKQKKPRKRLQTIKKVLWLFIAWCLTIQVYCLIMIAKMHDSTSLAIFSGTSVAEIVAIFKIYSDNSLEEKKKHMEMNYNPNYNEENNLK